MKNICRVGAVLFLSVTICSVSFANRIKFPEEELARESVLPVFDRQVAVKNRKIVTEGRGEIAPFYAISLNEPFYSPNLFGLQGTYHITEEHAVNLVYYGWFSQFSRYADKLTSQYDFKFDQAPKPQHLIMANHQYNMYYGKMSLAKNYVLNLSLYSLLGGGVIGFGDTVLPAVSGGLGQKFYFTPNVALRFDMRIVSFQGPNLLSRDLATEPSASVSDYKEQFSFYTLLSTGLTFMF